LLKYLLQNLWKNIFARIGIIFFIFILIFSLVYKSKNSIYTFFNQIFKGMEFDNPSSYAHQAYGYSENPIKAISLYKDGIEDMLDVIFDIYELSLPDKIFIKKINLKTHYKNSITNNIDKNLSICFSDMKLFCKSFLNKTGLANKIEKEEKLTKRTLELQVKNKPTPYSFILTKENYLNLRSKLIEIDMKYFERSFQKKPDNLALITLREQINEAICKPYNNIRFIKKAIYYLEYKTEKNYYYDQKNMNEKIDFEKIYDKTFSKLTKNKFYIYLLKKFFIQSKNITKDISWQLKKSLTLFLKTNDKIYLSYYIKNSLKKARTSSSKTATIIFNKLYAIQYKNISKDFDYVYALAEIAYLSHSKIKLAKRLVNSILKQHIYTNNNQYRKAKRLYTIIELDE